jgi:hypothetical protein
MAILPALPDVVAIAPARQEHHLHGPGLASLLLVVGVVAAAAQDMKGPRISHIEVDWGEAGVELNAIEALEHAAADRRHRPVAGERGNRLAVLNRAMDERFGGIAASAVPVLLPFDTSADLRERMSVGGGIAPAVAPITDYLSGFQAVPFFHPGPAGYDAVVVADPQEMRDLDIGYPEPIHILISGSALVYELEQSAGAIGGPVNGELESGFPGARRIFLDSQVRYTFVRYGVPYAIAIACSEGGSRSGMLTCREADKVAVRLIAALRLVGGTPQPRPQMREPATIERPAARSTVFTYHGPGNLLPGTGFRGRTGVADYTVYSRIRFPIADAPSFANSQVFMSWGDCDATGRLGAGMPGRTAAYSCRDNGQPLIRDESASENYSYPWRDNFCEHRFFNVGQCPGGFGHQGQDIRPAACVQRVSGASRCEPYRHDVVAVRDGVVLRAVGREGLVIVVNTPDERIRFRYLHMLPGQLDADGMVSGRRVREGEVIGKVGNYFKRERGTTYHLHFDVQVPTRNGWVFVNPYMTLVAAYERLIRGRGHELQEPVLGHDAQPALGQDIPTSSTPDPAAPQPRSPRGLPRWSRLRASGSLRQRPNRPGAAAAKPTETPVESP